LRFLFVVYLPELGISFSTDTPRGEVHSFANSLTQRLLGLDLA
jgi:hypothetical protein